MVIGTVCNEQEDQMIGRQNYGASSGTLQNGHLIFGVGGGEQAPNTQGRQEGTKIFPSTRTRIAADMRLRISLACGPNNLCTKVSYFPNRLQSLPA